MVKNRQYLNYKPPKRRKPQTEDTYVDADWKLAYSILKDIGMSIDKISKLIDGEFKNQLYNGYQMKINQFEKMRLLLGDNFPFEIKHRRGVTKILNFRIPKNCVSAEIIGYMLGDGHLGDYMSITMNERNEIDMLDYLEGILL